MENDEMMICFRHLDRKFRMSCHHIRVLNRQIEIIQVRYDRSLSSGQRTFRYSHRLKLATYEEIYIKNTPVDVLINWNKFKMF